MRFPWNFDRVKEEEKSRIRQRWKLARMQAPRVPMCGTTPPSVRDVRSRFMDYESRQPRTSSPISSRRSSQHSRLGGHRLCERFDDIFVIPDDWSLPLLTPASSSTSPPPRRPRTPLWSQRVVETSCCHTSRHGVTTTTTTTTKNCCAANPSTPAARTRSSGRESHRRRSSASKGELRSARVKDKHRVPTETWTRHGRLPTPIPSGPFIPQTLFGLQLEPPMEVLHPQTSSGSKSPPLNYRSSSICTDSQTRERARGSTEKASLSDDSIREPVCLCFSRRAADESKQDPFVGGDHLAAGLEEPSAIRQDDSSITINISLERKESLDVPAILQAADVIADLCALDLSDCVVPALSVDKQQDKQSRATPTAAPSVEPQSSSKQQTTKQSTTSVSSNSSCSSTPAEQGDHLTTSEGDSPAESPVKTTDARGQLGGETGAGFSPPRLFKNLYQRVMMNSPVTSPAAAAATTGDTGGRSTDVTVDPSVEILSVPSRNLSPAVCYTSSPRCESSVVLVDFAQSSSESTTSTACRPHRTESPLCLPSSMRLAGEAGEPLSGAPSLASECTRVTR